MQTPTFESDCHATVSRLRAALIALYDAAGADPLTPQDVARRFGINKTLTWSISRLLDTPDSLRALAFVPGIASLDKLADAVSSTGAHLVEVKEKVREAARDVERMIEHHVGDRATLELIVDNFGTESDDVLELSRRLAFRGNSGICGVQARTRLMTYLVTPNPERPDRFDIATILGYVGIRRLRPGVEWTIFKARHFSTQPAQLRTGWQSIDEDDGVAPGLALLRRFCAGELPTMALASTEEGQDFVMRRGPVGNTGAFDCFRAEILRDSVERYASAGESTGELGATITTPCETLVFDILFHAELAAMMTPELFVFGRTFAHGERTPGRDDPSVLPIRQRLMPIVGAPPAVATTMVPQYSEMLKHVAAKLNWPLADLRGLRMEMKYPPMNSHITLRFPLATR